MSYQNFQLAIYCPVHDVEKIADNPAQFVANWAYLEKQLQVDKVYLETYRGRHQVNREALSQVKEFFSSRGIKTSGGITPDASGNWEFKSLCYSNPQHRELLKQVVQYTAELFDEIILDDFFFTNCKCPSCIQAKGEQSWSEFRLQTLKEVSETIILKTARQINPQVKVIIKYPNWYEDYQTTGYNLEAQPPLFDQIYTGTETRDPRHTQQTLQRYLSYFLMRYLENVKPGNNGGGWFDTFDCGYNLNSYAEQGYLTLFAKAKEVTLFCLGSLFMDSIFIPIAGYVMEQTDRFLKDLGQPMGIACYKPYHSSGENYLHGYLGMLGLPLEPTPNFPSAANLLLLTESAAHDRQIIQKIKEQLLNGNTVVITSGLLKALPDQSFTELAQIQYTNQKAEVALFGFPMHDCAFGNYYEASSTTLIPQINFSTNDCVPVIVAFAESKVYPILLKTQYGSGSLYVLTIPDNFGDLYTWPAPVLNEIRKVLQNDLPIQLEGPANIGLFVYDNHTFIVESFLPLHTTVKLVIKQTNIQLKEVISGICLQGQSNLETTEFQLPLSPASYRVFQWETVSRGD